MNIDKYKKNGHYEVNGVYHEDAESVLRDILGFCGCGSPSVALMYVQKGLQLVRDRQGLTYDQTVGAEKKVFSDDGAKYFMWYYLDNKGFTEHGGSVPGWLTEKGEELLSDLTELLPILAEET